MSKRKKRPIIIPTCPQCGAKGSLTYPNDAGYTFYRCPRCPDVFVRCFDGTERPIGTMVNLETHAARAKTRVALDSLVASVRFSDLDDAHQWLARELAMDKWHVTVDVADMHLCERIMELCSMAAAKKRFRFHMELT